MSLAAITFNLNVGLGDIGLILALVFGLGSMSLAIYLGLHSFGTGITTSLSRIEEKVTPLSSMSTDVATSRQRLDDLWNVLSNSLPLLANREGGTVEADMPHLGRTRVSATPGPNSTEYRIETRAGVLSAALISKISRETELEKKENEMFGSPIIYTDLGQNAMIARVPSTDAALCAEYIKLFVHWLDTEYFEARSQLHLSFERGIFD